MGYIARNADEDVPLVRKISIMCFAVAIGVLAASMVLAVVFYIQTDNPAAVASAGLISMLGLVIAMVGLVVASLERRRTEAPVDEPSRG